MNKDGKARTPVLSDKATTSFQEAMDEVTPLSPHGRFLHPVQRLPPLPLSLFRDEREVILESLHDPIRWDEETENGDDPAYVRPGITRQVLRRLRRGEWQSQAELDLHGLTKLEAKHELAEFLHECRRRGVRCVRIVHGKGLRSPNREPVLKLHVRHWLTLRDEVLAYVQARAVDGGGGALVVLLKGR
ncbi:MAG: Smr/MutS family protein [Hydrogenophilales bacterium]|nr:Smr/MutS family protein [Hydrogenophilales bacterium]